MSNVDPLLVPPLGHSRSCPQLSQLDPDPCTCGLQWRIRLLTEIEHRNAWMKRATEAEAEVMLAKSGNMS